MRLIHAMIGAAIALAAVGASAADPKNILDVQVGEVVYDRQGGTVATVRRVGEEEAVVDTGTARITLGLGSFRRREGRLVLPMDRAALEAAANKVQAAGDGEILALLGPGAAVYDRAGERLGTVVSADAKQIVVEVDAVKVGMPIGAFVKGPEGARIAETRAEFVAKLETQRAALVQPVAKSD